MADWFRRIKAALTPQVLLLLLLAFLMIGYCALREEAGGADRLEKQASAVLSRMEGAGRVEARMNLVEGAIRDVVFFGDFFGAEDLEPVVRRLAAETTTGSGPPR